MKDFGTLLLVLLLIGLCVFLLWFFLFYVKHLKTPNVYMVDGGVKVGKTEVNVMLAVKQINKNRRKVRIFNFLRKFIGNPVRVLLRKELKKYKPMPMLYSNMPLNRVKYNALTLDIILMHKRMPPKSVVLIDEASLLADCMLGYNGEKNKRVRFNYVNERLTLFIKLFGHISCGGSLLYNSQQISDLHFSFKRCTSIYLFLAKRRRFPFFSLLYCRECVHTEDNDSVNTYTHDVDVDNRPLFVRNKWFKYYDQYYLSALVEHLPLLVDYDVVKYVKRADLKAKAIVTLGDYVVVKAFNKRKGVPEYNLEYAMQKEKELQEHAQE